MGGHLTDVGGHVGGRLLDGQHHHRGNDGDPDATEDAQRSSPDHLVGVLQGLLEGADREKGRILLLLGIAHEVHIHQLLYLGLGGGRGGRSGVEEGWSWRGVRLVSELRDGRGWRGR